MIGTGVSVAETTEYLLECSPVKFPRWRLHARRISHTALVYAIIRAIDIGSYRVDLEPVTSGIIAWLVYLLLGKWIERSTHSGPRGTCSPLLEWWADAWIGLALVLIAGAIWSAYWAPLFFVGLIPWFIVYLWNESLRSKCRERIGDIPPFSNITDDEDLD